LRQLARILDQRIDHGFGVLACQLHQHQVARLTFDQCGDLAVAPAEHQVPFPVARHRAIFDKRRAFADRHCVGDLPMDCGLLRVMARASHAARAPQVLEQFLFQRTARLNEETAVDRFVGHLPALVARM
jgi:hypothetical protein